MTTITRMSKTRKTWSARRISEGPIILFSRGKVLRSIPEYYRSLFEPYVWQGRCERTPVRGFVPPSLLKPSPQPPPPPPLPRLLGSKVGQPDGYSASCVHRVPKEGLTGGRRESRGAWPKMSRVCRQNSTSCDSLTKAPALWINYCNYIISLFR